MANLVKVFCYKSYQYRKLLKNTLEQWNSYAGVSFYTIAFIYYTARNMHRNVGFYNTSFFRGVIFVKIEFQSQESQITGQVFSEFLDAYAGVSFSIFLFIWEPYFIEIYLFQTLPQKRSHEWTSVVSYESFDIPNILWGKVLMPKGLMKPLEDL